MYIWFVYEDWDGKEAPTINEIDVREMPRGASRSTSTTTPPSSSTTRDLLVRIMKFTNTSRGEFRADVAGRQQTFRTVHPNMLSRWREGDLVLLTVQGSNSVTDMKPPPDNP
jgi:hypothetical protein